MLKAIQTLHALTCVATDCHIGCKTNNRALHRRFARLVPGYHILHHKGAATRSCKRLLGVVTKVARDNYHINTTHRPFINIRKSIQSQMQQSGVCY